MAAAAVSKRRSTPLPKPAAVDQPRWSLSRSPSLAPFGPPGAADDRARGTTPFCYATPHSNAAPEQHLPEARHDGGAPGHGGHDDVDMNCASDTDDSDMAHDADEDFDIEVYETRRT